MSWVITGPMLKVDKCSFVNANTGVETDETADINNDTANDVMLPPQQVTTVQDRIYFGKETTFNRIRVNVGTAGVYSGVTLRWQYWNGSAWVEVPSLTDGTNGFQNSGVNYVEFPIPTDWQKDGDYYKIRCVVTALATPSLTTAPLATQAWLISEATLPIAPTRIIDSYPSKTTVFDVPGSQPIIVSWGPQARSLTLEGVLFESGKTKANLEIVYIAPLKNMVATEVTLSFPDTRYDGTWILTDFDYNEEKSTVPMFRYTFKFVKGQSHIIL